MDKSINFFLLIRPKYFAIYAINKDYQILFKDDLSHYDKTFESYSFSIKKFLNKNIFKLEKKFNLYIEDINLIIDHKNFIKIDLSLTKNFKDLSKQINISLNDLSNIKESILKNNTDFELIHMIINKYIIDKKVSVIKLVDNFQKDIFLEIGMICLKKDTINGFREILSSYQISIRNIFYFDYVNSFKNVENENISVLAYKLYNGLNSNEIIFRKKTPKKIGFFEKFFRFFN